MKSFFNIICFNFKEKKGVFIFLFSLTLITIVLAVFAGINFSDDLFTIDLSNICYIQFLKGECGWFSLIFRFVVSLSIFAILFILFSCKKFLLPISYLFYLYLVYSQVVVIVSLIVIYGILNCLILVLLLILFNIILFTLFLCLQINLVCNCNSCNYFQNCFNLKNGVVSIYLLFILVLVLIFSLILIILKSFVLLLVF